MTAARPAWKPLVICPNQAMAARVRSALAEQGLEDVSFLPQYPAAGIIAGFAAQHGSNICFLDIASDPERALLLIPEAARSLQVVALNPRKDADIILYCLRLGACEFLSEPTGEEIRNLLDRLGRNLEPAAAAKPCLACCVMPGKPGSGASTLATCLAVELKRCGASKVLLVDADAAAATVSFLLKLKPAFHLGDAVRDWNRMDEDLWVRLAAHSHGVDVLPAPDDPGIRVEIQPRAAMELLAFWRQHYEAIVVDVAATHAPGEEFAALADEVLLATSNDLAALHATRRAREWLEKNSVDSTRLKLLVTRYTPSAGLKRDEVESALKAQPYAVLPHDWDAVQSALLDGRPVAPGSPFGRAVHSLAEKLLGKQPAAGKRSSFFGLLSARR
jgi:pilus assembly protein CpaE